MIPEWKDLRKKAKKVKVLDEAYFALANEYVDLKSEFECDYILETILLWFDMIIYPIYVLIRLSMLDFSPAYIMCLVKTYKLWIDWFRVQEIERKVDLWKTTVRSLGGPWIVSNSPELHVFVYADGMERIKYSRERHLYRKTEKRSPKVQLPVQSQASSLPKCPLIPSEVP